jgi:RNAse (barnase) inhibitor barstar
MDKQRLVINEGVTSKAAFHDEMRRLLQLADWYGANLDAFNDVLGGGCGAVDPEGMVFVWQGHAAAKAAIGDADWADIFEVFEDDDDSGHEAFSVVLM